MKSPSLAEAACNAFPHGSRAELLARTLCSQKARGIVVMLSMPIGGSTCFMVNRLLSIYDPVTQMLEPHRPFPLFARPCPITPRHGFVDSKIVNSNNAIRTIFDAALEADPEAELVLTLPITALFSAIITPAGLSIGPGNAGATDGKNSIFIPCPGDNTLAGLIKPDFLALIGITDTLFTEFVYSKSSKSPVIVQLRDGPALPSTCDSIPRAMTVRTIINPENRNLLAWEKYIAKLAKDKANKNIVVCLPNSTLASHYAVHAIVAGLTVVTSHKVEIKEKLAPAKLATWTGGDYVALAKRIKFWAQNNPTGNHIELRTALASVHCAAVWPPEKHLVELIAFGVTRAFWFMASACVAEGRHWFRHGGGVPTPGVGSSGSRLMPTLPVEWIVMPGEGSADDENNNSRDMIYARTFEIRIDRLARLLDAARIDFSGKWNGSFGGSNWLEAAEQALGLYHSVATFYQRPSQKTFRDLIRAWNSAVHTAHNGGRLIDKWVSGKVLDIAHAGPAVVLNNVNVWEILSGATKQQRHPVLSVPMRWATGAPQEPCTEHWAPSTDVPATERVEEAPDNACDAKPGELNNILTLIHLKAAKVVQFYGQFKAIQHDTDDTQLHIQIPVSKRNRPYGISFDLNVAANEYSDIAGGVIFDKASHNKQPSNYGGLDIQITKPPAHGDPFTVIIRVENNPQWISCSEVPGYTFNALAAMMFAPDNIMYDKTI